MTGLISFLAGFFAGVLINDAAHRSLKKKANKEAEIRNRSERLKRARKWADDNL